MLENSLVIELLVAVQEGLSSMELVTWLVKSCSESSTY
jgi:hypothetical protein